MARDMDFSLKRGREVVKASLPVTPTAPIKNTTPAQGKNAWTVFLWLVVIAIIAVGIWAFWHYFQPTAASQKPASTTPLSTAPASTTDSLTTGTNNLVATKSTLPTVQVYDSGAGSEAVNKVLTNLKAIGYSAENKDKSQFNYSKTYIWYITGLQAEAEKIQSTLTGRTVELKESKSAGSFEIMILLGTK